MRTAFSDHCEEQILAKKINFMNPTSAPDSASFQRVHGRRLPSAPIGALDAHD
jgi:hypothetical protein